MEFIPQLMVTGGYAVPPELQLGGTVDEDRLVAIYRQVRNAGFPYQGFQLDPNGAGAVIQGQPPGEMVTVRPPLIQVQSVLMEDTVDTGAHKAQEVAAVVTQILGVAQIAQLAIRVIYNAPLPSNDARDFMLNHLLSRGGEHVQDLSLGGDLWGGVKFVVTHPEGQYTFNVEPSLADQMQSLYIEIDAQFPGTHAPSAIVEKAAQVRDYVSGQLGSYLDKIAAE
jgi:hypothetical protein